MDEQVKFEIEKLQKKIQSLENERNWFSHFYSENKSWIRFFSISFIMTALIVHATVPNVFTANTVISAQQMNDNFNFVEKQVAGTTVAYITSAPNLTFTTSSSEFSFDGTNYIFQNNYFLSGTGTGTSNLNSATVYNVTVSGWYDIYLEADFSHTLSNITSQNYLNINVNASGVAQLSGNLVGQSFFVNSGLSINLYDANGDSTFDLTDPDEYTTYRNYGEMKRVYLSAGDNVGVKLYCSLKMPGDSVTLNSYKLLIKKVTI